MSESEAAPAFVRGSDRAKRGAIDGRLIVAGQVAGDVVPPKRTRLQRTDHVEKFVEPVDAHAVHDVRADW